MKTRNKALLIALCAVLLVAATALTTIAWLTSTTDTVVNTFTFSDSDNIKIELDELKVDEYGKELVKVSDDGTNKEITKEQADKLGLERTPCDRVFANTYKLIPGHKYIKDPTIHVKANSIDCYLFVTVDNAIADIEDGTTIAAQMAAHGWVKVTGYTNVYAYYGVAAEGEPAPTALKLIARNETADQDIVVFESFTIKGEPTAKELEKYDEKTVLVKAYAVQAEGFENKNAVKVWEAAFSGKGTKETSSTPVEEPSTDGAGGE